MWTIPCLERTRCSPELLYLTKETKKKKKNRKGVYFGCFKKIKAQAQEDPLEEEMAAHSSILAWKSPWMVEPGRLQSTGLQRVGHN